MSLGVYKDSSTEAITIDSSYANPVKFEMPLTGASVEQRYYLKADTTTEAFSNIIISAVDTAGDDESGWMTFALDSNNAPSSYGATLETSIDFNETRYFWIKVTNPATSTVTTKTDVRVLVKYIRITV